MISRAFLHQWHHQGLGCFCLKSLPSSSLVLIFPSWHLKPSLQHFLGSPPFQERAALLKGFQLDLQHYCKYFFGASVHFVGGLFVCWRKSFSVMFLALHFMVNLCPERNSSESWKFRKQDYCSDIDFVVFFFLSE